jgi:7-cyano-7-deazaguanine synthase in queuosine biosynthesis
VINDDAVSYIDDIRKVWEALQGICGATLPKLAFPLLKTSKQEIADDLGELAILTFSCERPLEVGKPCGACGSCRRSPLKIPDVVWPDPDYEI